MTLDRTPEYLTGLIAELSNLKGEAEWVEFKENNADPQEIGEYVSALANSAPLCGKPSAYLVWGIRDRTHEVVGTSFVPGKQKVGNEELENWLLRAVKPKIDFRFFAFNFGIFPVVVMEIGRAFRHPVAFQGVEFIRVGTYKKKLKDYPERERELWRILDATPFESLIAVERTAPTDVLRLLDYPAYFELMNRPLPDSRMAILNALAESELIHSCEAGGWNITNLGAVLFARRLDDFRSLKRKPIRVIQYQGNSRIATLREQVGSKGYASGFEGLISYINGILPSNEIIHKALRETVPVYPEIAVRELVANALIHQDFFVVGAGPMVEIFSDRMEISNPGKPLVDTSRFLDTPPKSRNESLASLMRLFGICEERGSGIDKVVFETELYQLPAPSFEHLEETTRAVLFSPKPLTRMVTEDRIRACYLHACLRYVNRDFMTNTTLRERFGISAENSAIASRLIKEATSAGAIRAHDSDAGKKYMKYVPFWA